MHSKYFTYINSFGHPINPVIEAVLLFLVQMEKSWDGLIYFSCRVAVWHRSTMERSPWQSDAGFFSYLLQRHFLFSTCLLFSPYHNAPIKAYHEVIPAGNLSSSTGCTVLLTGIVHSEIKDCTFFIFLRTRRILQVTFPKWEEGKR